MLTRTASISVGELGVWAPEDVSWDNPLEQVLQSTFDMSLYLETHALTACVDLWLIIIPVVSSISSKLMFRLV